MIYEDDPEIQETLDELVLILGFQRGKDSEEIDYLRMILQRMFRAGVAYALRNEVGS